MVDGITQAIKKSQKNPSGYTLESSTLKYAPGSSINYQKSTADNTKTQIKVMKDSIEEIKKVYDAIMRQQSNGLAISNMV